MAIRMNRRQALAIGAATTLAPGIAHAATESPSRQPICVFTKPFTSLAFGELADRIADLGVRGIEAPIRKGGHIEAANVEDRLPKLVEALRTRNLEITIMASDINDPRDPTTEQVLRTAASVGIRQYRMKYLRYDLDRPIIDQLKEWRPRLRELATMNHELGIQAVYQNHAGRNLLGAPVWDLRYVLEDIPIGQLAVAYDIRHATVEGGTSWPITFNLIRPHIDMVYVKDFRWIGKKVQNVPLGEGHIDPKFFRMLADSGYRGPCSLHEEYLDHRKPELVPRHLEAIKKDLATLTQWLEH